MQLARAEFKDRLPRLKSVKGAVEMYSGMRFAIEAPGTPPKTQTAKLPPNLETFVNSVGILMVKIPSGEFRMGNPSAKLGDKDSPKNVTISSPFYMSVFEVPQSSYASVRGERAIVQRDVSSTRRKGVLVRQADAPIHYVSWYSAAQFCLELSKLPSERAAQRTYRLPTEAEWEYACRGRTTTMFSFGDTQDLQGREANWYRGPKGRGHIIDRPHPVGRYKPNAFGLFDMHGNVLEWCVDNPGSYSDLSAA